ncbi:MAG: ribosomal protein S18-alanine N-acetyltransferase [Pseudomonadota bacterium]
MDGACPQGQPFRLRVRSDIQDDAEAWRAHAALRAEAFPNGAPWSAESIANLCKSPAVVCLEARSGAALVGFLLLRVAGDEAEILTLCCGAKSRRRGVGRALVEGALREAKNAETKAVFLEVAVGNGAARALYSAAGFENVGRRPGYYPRTDRGAEDALVLRNQLEE